LHPLGDVSVVTGSQDRKRGAVVNVRDKVLVLAAFSGLVAGCPSGPLGRRPVVEFDTPATDGETRDEITIHFNASDDDLSPTHVTIEYSADGGAWQPATIVSSTAGTPGVGSVSNLPGTRGGIACDAVWDSWADLVGQAGDVTVSIRITPRDVDGTGAAITYDLPASVNNSFPELSIDRAAVAFTTDLLDMGVEGLRDPLAETIVIANTGPTGPLSWTHSATYDAVNPVFGPDWLLLTPATGGAESVQLDADVDGSMTGTALVAGTYTAWFEIDAGTAHASPQIVTVTLVVREQRPDVQLDKALIEFECIEGQTSPADQTFTVTNSGEDATLYWWTSALPSWLSFNPPDNTVSSGGGLAQGAFDTVTVSIVASLTLPAMKYYEATITVYGEGAGGEPVLGTVQTITVRLWVKVPQRIDFDATSLSFAGAIEEVSNPAQATQSVTLTNGGEVDLGWTAAAPVYAPVVTSWLTVDTAAVASPLGSGASGQVDFIVDSDAAGIAAGTYTATVEFSDPGASNSPRTVTVTLEVLPRAEIVCDTTPLTFYYYLDLGAAPGDQTVTITNPGATGLVWTAGDGNYSPAMAPADEWLSAAPGGPATTAAGGTSDLMLSIDASGIVAPGIYQADIVIAGTDEIGLQTATGSPKTVHVTFDVRYDPNLVAYWKLDDGAGSETAADSSGNGNTATLGSTPTGDTNDPTWGAGKIGGALDFDGIDDYALLDIADWVATEYTVALWVRAGALGQGVSTGIFANNDGSPSGANLQMDVDGGNPGDYRINYGGTILAIGQASLDWSFLTVTYDGSYVRSYIDGGYVGSDFTGPPSAGTDFTHYVFGRSRAGGLYFDGFIDDVRVYDRALSAAEIADLIPTPAIGRSPATLSFNATEGGADPTAQTVQITNPGEAGSVLRWSASADREWLQASPSSGTTTTETDTLTVSPTLTVPDAWVAPPSTLGAPSGRGSASAVWTGTEMIVWGGAIGYGVFTNTGARYDPDSDTWTATRTTGAPPSRNGHTAVWTGTEMIVFGGRSGSVLSDAWRYNPATDTWAQIIMTGAPARNSHAAVWTGSEMIIWGGNDGTGRTNDGWRYNLGANTWTPLVQSGDIPSARREISAAWTGTEMVIWGGRHMESNPYYTATGGRYNPATEVWTALATTGAPPAKGNASVVWTGKEIIVWGGISGWNGQFATNAGGCYDLGTDTWQSTTTAGAPSVRGSHVAVWDGSQMVAWGGYNGVSWFCNDGGKYRPPAELTAGVYNGTATISDPKASNDPQTVDVVFTVSP
jgi:N-acetylneuraminic acid mutarotase